MSQLREQEVALKYWQRNKISFYLLVVLGILRWVIEEASAVKPEVMLDLRWKWRMAKQLFFSSLFSFAGLDVFAAFCHLLDGSATHLPAKVWRLLIFNRGWKNKTPSENASAVFLHDICELNGFLNALHPQPPALCRSTSMSNLAPPRGWHQANVLLPCAGCADWGGLMGDVNSRLEKS